jgi:hypothetical protein
MCKTVFFFFLVFFFYTFLEYKLKSGVEQPPFLKSISHTAKGHAQNQITQSKFRCKEKRRYPTQPQETPKGERRVGTTSAQIKFENPTSEIAHGTQRNPLKQSPQVNNPKKRNPTENNVPKVQENETHWKRHHG